MAQRLLEIFSRTLSPLWRRVLLFLSLLLLLTLLLLLAAPSLLSLNAVQNRLKSRLSTTLSGPVEWSSLQLSWLEGVQLRNLTIGPAPGSLRRVRIAALDFSPGFGFGAKAGESFGLNLFLHLHDLHLDLAPPASRAAPPPLPAARGGEADPLARLAEGLERFSTMSLPLPIDLRVDVAIDPITLRYGQEGGRIFHYREGALQLQIPSLESRALSFSLDGKVTVDSQELGALHIATQLTGLVAPSGRIVPAGAFFAGVVTFPGIAMKGDGRLDQEEGVKGELRLDLPLLQETVAPFLPAGLPLLGGTLLATLQARVDKEENLTMQGTLSGLEVRGHGGSLPASGIGPINFDLGQEIRTDHQRRMIFLEKGFFKMPPLLSAEWEGTIAEPTGTGRRVTARLKELRVDLHHLLALAAPLLPADLPQIAGGQLALRDLDLQLNGLKGDGEVRLAEVKLLLPSLHLLHPSREITGAGIVLTASDLQVPLIAYFPATLAARFDWKIAGLQLSGTSPLSLQEAVGSGGIEIDAIRLADQKGGGSGHGRFRHQLRFQSLEAPGLARISNLVNDLSLAFSLLGDGSVKVETLHLDTTIAAVLTTVAGKELPPLAIDQKMQVDGVELVAHAPLPRIRGLTFSLTSPRHFLLSGTASLGPERLLTLATRSRFELSPLLALVKPLLTPGLTATGTIGSDLMLQATLPDRPLPGNQAPLRRAQGALALLQKMNGSVELDGVEMELPLPDGNLHLRALATPQPLRLESRQNGREIDLSGSINFDLCSGSVIHHQALPAEHGEITARAEVRDWERIFLRQGVKIEPLGLAQQSEGTITGLSSLLDLPLPPTPATLLQRLDATLFAEVEVNLPSDAPPLVPELRATGRTSLTTRMDLRAGRSLDLHLAAASKDLDLEIAKGPQLRGLQVHLTLDRSLRITSAAAAPERWRPLSTSLVQPLLPVLPPPGAGEGWRLHNDLRGHSSGERSLRLASLFLPVAPLPLTFQALEGEVVTGTEEVGMNFLQLELLGGTLRTRALVDLRPVVPVVIAEALFTNLDLARLAGRSEALLRPGDAESSISGEGRLLLPLLTEERPLLEGLTLTGRLRHVGAKSFDRALASLDPFERNEAITSQRKLLRLSQLQGVEVQVADGALSLSGAITTAGATFALPKIDRLRLAEIPLHQALTPALRGIILARQALEFARADTIQLGSQGEISLRQEEK